MFVVTTLQLLLFIQCCDYILENLLLKRKKKNELVERGGVQGYEEQTAKLAYSVRGVQTRPLKPGRMWFSGECSQVGTISDRRVRPNKMRVSRELS